MRELGSKVIDVRRTDLVRSVISNRIAIETKIYHSSELGANTALTGKIRIDPYRLVRKVDTIVKAYENITRFFQNYRGYLRIDYEEMFQAEIFSETVIDQVMSLIGVTDRFERRPQLNRLLGENIFSYVENADEVREFLLRYNARRMPENF